MLGQEKKLLNTLCKGYINKLIDEVGWTPVQNKLIKLRYIDHLEIYSVCDKLAISETTYRRYIDNTCMNLVKVRTIEPRNYLDITIKINSINKEDLINGKI